MNNFKIKQEIRKLVNKIYKNFPVGGGMHIILDDGNMENNHIKYCMNYIINDKERFTEEEKQIQLRCCELLLQLSYSKRIKLYKEKFCLK